MATCCIIHLSKFIECMTPRVNQNVNSELWLTMTFISDNQCTTLHVDDAGGSVCALGVYGKSLGLALNFAVNSKLVFCLCVCVFVCFQWSLNLKKCLADHGRFYNRTWNIFTYLSWFLLRVLASNDFLHYKTILPAPLMVPTFFSLSSQFCNIRAMYISTSYLPDSINDSCFHHTGPSHLLPSPLDMWSTARARR